MNAVIINVWHISYFYHNLFLNTLRHYYNVLVIFLVFPILYKPNQILEASTYIFTRSKYFVMIQETSQYVSTVFLEFLEVYSYVLWFKNFIKHLSVLN
jgi:hypothetical protein